MMKLVRHVLYDVTGACAKETCLKQTLKVFCPNSEEGKYVFEDEQDMEEMLQCIYFKSKILSAVFELLSNYFLIPISNNGPCASAVAKPLLISHLVL